jgi:hypothetical protein
MDTEVVPARQRFTVVIRNTRDTAVPLFLEPGGADYLLPPGEEFELRAEGPEGDHLEIDFGPDRLIAWAWSGSVVDLWQNGANLSGLSTPVPSVPQGMSVRGFMGMVLGDPKLQDPD